MVLVGDAHHVADHLQWQRSGEFGHQLALAVGMVGDQVRDQPPRPVAHRLLSAGHHLRCEGAADDVAQPRVTWIVQVDHRAEVLGHLGGLVGDGDIRYRTEDLRMPAGVVDVIELHQRPVPGAGLESLVTDLLEEGDRRLPAQGRESPVSDGVVKSPELQGAEVDIGQWDLWGSLAIDAGCDPPGFDAHRDVPSLVCSVRRPQ